MATKEKGLGPNRRPQIIKRLLSWVEKLNPAKDGADALEREILRIERLLTASKYNAIRGQAFKKLNEWYAMTRKREDDERLLTPQDYLASMRALRQLMSEYHPEDKHRFLKRVDALEPLRQSIVSSPDFKDENDVRGLDESELLSLYDFEWEVHIRFHGDNRSPRSVTTLLSAIDAALSALPGVLVILDDWGKGSLWAQIKVYIIDTFKRDEVQEILDNARDSLSAEYLERPRSEIDKLIDERLKIQAERLKILKEIQLLPDPTEADELKKLDIEKRKLENLSLKTEILQKEIEARHGMLELIQYSSQLLKDGIISADPLTININDLLYLSFDKGAYNPGKKMSSISGRSPIKSRNTDDPPADISSNK
ncbi:MAG: hypothetical protein AAGI52_14320 [Bacteroidota bacterium]